MAANSSQTNYTLNIGRALLIRVSRKHRILLYIHGNVWSYAAQNDALAYGTC